MRVRCLITEITNPSAELKKSGWWQVDRYLTIGEEYEVYAVHHSWFGEIPGYMVYTDKCLGGEVYYFPACLFEIVDYTKPPFWAISPEFPDYEGPREFAPDKYEALVDGEPDAVSLFERIRSIYEDVSMFDYLERGDYVRFLEKHPDDLCVVVNESVCGTNNLIETIYRGLGNKYTALTLDGLHEALGTLGWITNQTVRLVHLGLPSINESDQKTYLSILRDVCKEWNEDRGREYANYLNIEFHVCFLREMKNDIEAIFYQTQKER